MALVTGFTAERMLEIENTTVVDGEVQGDNLVLITREGQIIQAGNVRGPKGDVGPPVTRLDDIGDVNAPTPADKMVLGYDLASQMWIPTFRNLDDLGNVVAPTATARQYLGYDLANSRWIPYPEPITVDGKGDLTKTLILHRPGSELTEVDGTGTLQIGLTGGINLGFDWNEIQARNAGAVTTLYIQQAGGPTAFGANVQVAHTAQEVLTVVCKHATTGPTIVLNREALGDIGVIGFAGANNLYVANIAPAAQDGKILFQLTPAPGASNPSATASLQLLPNGVSPTGMVVWSGSIYNLTTATAANVFINTNGFLYRSTSSLLYKTDVEPLDQEHADKIYDLNPVFYRSIAPGDTMDWSYYGLIAEEVAEIDPHLVTWEPTPGCDCDINPEPEYDMEGNVIPPVTVDMEGHTCLRPTYVQYDRIVPHLISVAKDQKAKLESFETRLAALESV